ncbi:MAG: sulfite exporter TauE/SafE family protein [Armatimonadetes bacterium]|nr:sulfite exporter TauE/SafE family protein [Armatimonadota bacterium]
MDLAAYESLLRAPSLLGYLVLIAFGFVVGITPCNLPMIPVVVGYVGGYSATSRAKTVLASLMFVLGSGIAFGILGAALVGLSGVLRHFLGKAWYVTLGVACVVIGLALLEVIPLKIPSFQAATPSTGGLLGALLIGVVLSMATASCCFAPMGAIAAYASLQGKIVHGTLSMFSFGIGKGIPLFAVGMFTGALRSMAKAATWAYYIQKASGVLMILAGFYLLWLVG